MASTGALLAAACAACPAGKYTPSGASTVCLSCAAGKIQAASSSTACVACAAGFSAYRTGEVGGRLGLSGCIL